MLYDASLLPEDWNDEFSPFPKAFKNRDPEALTNVTRRSSREYFERLCLSWNDFEEAGFAAKELRNWSTTKYIQPTTRGFAERPEYYSDRQDLRLKGCVETTMVVAYSRPFSTGRNGEPIGFKQIGLKLKDSTNNIHQKILDSRDTLFAHSDPQRRRFLWPSYYVVEGGNVADFERLSNPVFPLGGFFNRNEIHQIELMVFEILTALRNTMVSIAENLDPPLLRPLPAELGELEQQA